MAVERTRCSAVRCSALAAKDHARPRRHRGLEAGGPAPARIRAGRRRSCRHRDRRGARPAAAIAASMSARLVVSSRSAVSSLCLARLEWVMVCAPIVTSGSAANAFSSSQDMQSSRAIAALVDAIAGAQRDISRATSCSFGNARSQSCSRSKAACFCAAVVGCETRLAAVHLDLDRRRQWRPPAPARPTTAARCLRQNR